MLFPYYCNTIYLIIIIIWEGKGWLIYQRKGFSLYISKKICLFVKVTIKEREEFELCNYIFLSWIFVGTRANNIELDVCVSYLVEKSSNIYLIWTKNTQYPIYWFASKYASSMLLAQVLCDSWIKIHKTWLWFSMQNKIVLI